MLFDLWNFIDRISGPVLLTLAVVVGTLLIFFLGSLLIWVVLHPRRAYNGLRDSWREASDEVDEEHRRAREASEAEER